MTPPYPVTIITLFPEMFPGMLGHSVIGRALRNGLVTFNTVNIRDFATGKHKQVDDIPYGGGAGMVMRPDVVAQAIESAKKSQPNAPVIYLSARGKALTQAMAQGFSENTNGLILLCGHYEGIDQRVLDTHVDTEVRVGDYVLTGGEPAAQLLLDATLRLLPNVLGGDASLHEESFNITHPETGALLQEYPHYTRPADWEGQEVPAVLRSGNHGEIAKWRLQKATETTAKHLTESTAQPTDSGT